MEVKVMLKTKNGDSFAEAIYYGGKTVVKAGGKISPEFATCIRGGRAAKKYRDNRSFVDENGRIIQDCEFTSPSTAAQFVTGRSRSGYIVWKISNTKTLGDFLEEQGLR